MGEHDSVRAVEWRGSEGVRLLDQRRLPGEVAYVDCHDVDAVVGAIRGMAVRGAPAIAIAAAYGCVLAARAGAFEPGREALAAARPTAVNLRTALARMAAAASGGESALLAEAQRLHAEDVDANRRMGAIGASLIQPGRAVLTHCNTGSLATGGFGTALGVIRQAWSEGRLTGVYAGETRPWLQGARLTAWELQQDAIPVQLVADAAAPALLRDGGVGWVIVGADRVAANGDVANKIGTYALALAARSLGVKVMVVASTATLDPSTPDGDAVRIEHRDADELLSLGGRRVAPEGVAAWNPVFDITPAELVDVLVTERGLVHAPDAARLDPLMSELAGAPA